MFGDGFNTNNPTRLSDVNIKINWRQLWRSLMADRAIPMGLVAGVMALITWMGWDALARGDGFGFLLGGVGVMTGAGVFRKLWDESKANDKRS